MHTNDLARVASAILEVDGEITWAQPAGAAAAQPEEMTRIARVLSKIDGARLSRARQFFYHCLVARVEINNPSALEVDIDDAVTLLRAQVLP